VRKAVPATAVSRLECLTRVHDYEVTLVPAHGAHGHQITPSQR